MDSLTHIIVGASVGEAFLGKKAGKRAMVFGALAGTAPDVDAVMNFFVSDVDSLVLHRGITHSVLVALLVGPLLGWLIWRHYKGLRGSNVLWMAMITVSILIHLMLDTATMYGTMLLTPISDHRFSFDNIFVVDPLYTIPIVISFTALLFLRSDHPARGKWNKSGLLISTFYMALTFANHNSALNALQNSTDLTNKNNQEYFAVPTLMNSFLWNVVVMDGDEFLVGYYSIFDDRDAVELYTVSKNDHLAGQVSDQESLEKLRVFSKGFYNLSEQNGKIYFNDLRFGQVEGWNDPESGFAFSFDLSPEANNTMVVQQGRIEGSSDEMLMSLWNRIKGN